MLNKIKILLISLLCLTPLYLAAAPAGLALNPDAKSQIQCGVNEAAGSSGCGVSGNPSSDLSDLIKTVLNVLSAIAGVIAVIMIMVAGLRYVASAGSEEAVKKAKSSIVYAVVGIIIVAFAQIIVHFVIGNVSRDPSTSSPKSGKATSSSATPNSSGGLTDSSTNNTPPSSASGLHGNQTQ